MDISFEWKMLQLERNAQCLESVESSSQFRNSKAKAIDLQFSFEQDYSKVRGKADMIVS